MGQVSGLIMLSFWVSGGLGYLGYKIYKKVLEIRAKKYGRLRNEDPAEDQNA